MKIFLFTYRKLGLRNDFPFFVYAFPEASSNILPSAHFTFGYIQTISNARSRRVKPHLFPFSLMRVIVKSKKKEERGSKLLGTQMEVSCLHTLTHAQKQRELK